MDFDGLVWDLAGVVTTMGSGSSFSTRGLDLVDADRFGLFFSPK